jgi:hypothetical protein
MDLEKSVDKLEAAFEGKRKQRQKEEAMYIEDTQQRLVTEERD